MEMTRRTVGTLLALAASGVGRGAIAADPYPSKPIKLIVPYAAGGVGDIVARLFGEKASKELGQTIVVDNRSGANSVIGTEYAARSRPDGYTMIQMTPANVVVTALQAAPFDLQKDFTTVIGIGEGPLAMVVPKQLNINTVAELASYARSLPNGLNYATGGLGSMGHLGIARLMHELNIKSTPIHYRGSAPASQSILSNTTQLWFAVLVDVAELSRSGKVKVIAVTSEQRTPILPDVPTMVEQGFKDFTPTVWYAYNVPAGTPQEIIDKLAAAFAQATAQPDPRARLLELGVTIKITPGPEMAKFMHEDFLRWKQVIVENDITAQG